MLAADPVTITSASKAPSNTTLIARRGYAPDTRTAARTVYTGTPSMSGSAGAPVSQQFGQQSQPASMRPMGSRPGSAVASDASRRAAAQQDAAAMAQHAAMMAGYAIGSSAAAAAVCAASGNASGNATSAAAAAHGHAALAGASGGGLTAANAPTATQTSGGGGGANGVGGAGPLALAAPSISASSSANGRPALNREGAGSGSGGAAGLPLSGALSLAERKGTDSGGGWRHGAGEYGPGGGGGMSGGAAPAALGAGSALAARTDDVIVIHVCDDNRRINRDFYCSRELLLRHMAYFAPYLADERRFDEIDISVHCDVHIFEWLMEYIHQPSKPPNLDPGSVISVLISADFLQMKPLADHCIEFLRSSLPEVLRLPIDLSCVSDTLLTQLASNMTADEIERSGL